MSRREKSVEALLPEDFDDLGEKEKLAELERLGQELDTETDSGRLKKRIIEELIRKYSG